MKKRKSTSCQNETTQLFAEVLLGRRAQHQRRKTIGRMRELADPLLLSEIMSKFIAMLDLRTEHHHKAVIRNSLGSGPQKKRARK